MATELSFRQRACALAAALLLAHTPLHSRQSEPSAVNGDASGFRRAPQPLKSEAARELLTSLGIAEHTDQRLSAVVNDLMHRRDRRLIPFWQEKYEEATAHEDTLMPASVLVFLGADDPKYWSLLYGEAKAAVESGMPAREEMADLPFEHPELKTWREERGLTNEQRAELVWQQMSTMIAFGAAVDPRAFDLLVDCVLGPNQYLYLPCMQGLARLQDKRAIEPMITALGRMSVEAADGGVRFLLYFDDARAQKAAELFAKDKEQLELWRKTVAEQGLRGLYGY